MLSFSNKIVVCLLCLLGLSGGVFGIVIDDMDSTSGWQAGNDSGALISVTESTESVSGNSVSMGYSFPAGQWVEITKDYRYMDFSIGDHLQFYYKGTGKNNLQIEFDDADGTAFRHVVYSNAVDQPNWTLGNVAYAGDELNTSDIGGGDNILDTKKIVKINFGATTNQYGGVGGQGTLDIDDVKLFLQSPAIFVMDEFNNFTSINHFGGDSGAYNGDIPGICTRVYVSTEHFTGAGALELNYNVTGANQYCGYWSKFGDTPPDMSNASHLSFWVKGTQGGEKFKIEISAITSYIRVQNYITVSKDWQQVLVPLSNFSAFVSSAPIGSFVITFENNINGIQTFPQLGTIYIDDIKFIQPGSSNTVVAIIDSMDDEPSTVGAWRGYAKTVGAVDNLRSIPGHTGALSDRAVEMPYNLPTSGDEWVVMERNGYLNVTPGTTLRFKYKGKGGADNIELKVVDKNDTVFIKRLFYAAETNDRWLTAEIPYKEMTYFTGTSQTLDLANIKGLRFAISKNLGTAGKVWLDDIEYVTPTAFETTGSKIIDSLSIPDNPFSPNGDGSKDKAKFIFKLKDNANITLEIFTLKGELIYSHQEDVISDGQLHLFEWDGKNKGNERVGNGLYIYKFSAEGSDGTKDKIVHLIGVIR